MRRYPNFDILRLVLAGIVVYRHVLFAVDPWIKWPYPIFPVPAFLGLSGYLVLRSLMEGKGATDGARIRAFWRRRALRIAPAFVVSLCLTLALFGWPRGFTGPLTTYFTAGMVQGSYNGPLWSLLPEEVAYGSMCLLWVAGGYKNVRMLWTLFAASLLWTYWSYCSTWGYVQEVQIIQLIPAFLAGNLLYVYRERVDTRWGWPLMGIVLLGNAYSQPMREWMAVSGMLGAAACVMIGASAKQARWWRLPDLSYGIYIYHLPLLIALKPYGVDVAILATLAVSVFSWYLVEKPCLALKGRTNEKAAPAIGQGLASNEA